MDGSLIPTGIESTTEGENMSSPTGASVADYVTVALVDGIAKDGQHTLSDRSNTLLRVYAFCVNEDPGVPGSTVWWGLLAEALSLGSDLAVLSTRQRALIEAHVTKAQKRATPSGLDGCPSRGGIYGPEFGVPTVGGLVPRP